MSRDASPERDSSESDDVIMLKWLEKNGVEWAKRNRKLLHKMLCDEPPHFALSRICNDSSKARLSERLLKSGILRECSEHSGYSVLPIAWIKNHFCRLQYCVQKKNLCLDETHIEAFAARGYKRLLCKTILNLRHEVEWFEDDWTPGFNDGSEEWDVLSSRQKARISRKKIQAIMHKKLQKPQRDFCLVYFAVKFDCAYPVLSAFSICQPKLWKALSKIHNA
jgi:hypothetical protein